MTNKKPKFPPQFKVIHNCLYEVRSDRNGTEEKKLCNFVPWITAEDTVDDGLVTDKKVWVKGIHETGRPLPEIPLSIFEFASLSWIPKYWGLDCMLEMGSRVRSSVGYALQSTAADAEHRQVYAVTGWRKIQDQWHFLMPGDQKITVELPSKMEGYSMAQEYSRLDVCAAACLLHQMPAPPEIFLPMLAFAFLSPLNHFLKLAGHEPKFILFLIGRSGSRKSSLSAAVLSFFGYFSNSMLPLSFRDTANSILYNAFSLKDVLTCIDDFHPAGRLEEDRLTNTAQSVMRAYGDRTGKGRLNAFSAPMESRPPQGNAILTGEYPPNIGESGTARYFALEMTGKDVILPNLSAMQKAAQDGVLQRCMYGYICWLKENFLSDPDTEFKFVQMLKNMFLENRSAFQKSDIPCHGRVPEMVSWLLMGMHFFLAYMKSEGALPDEECASLLPQFQEMLYGLAARQAANISEDKPTHVFIRKFFSLLESGRITVVHKDCSEPFVGDSFVGYEDDVFYYLQTDTIHSMVKKLCSSQGECLTGTSKSLLKALAEEALISTSGNQNTKILRTARGVQRFMWLNKKKAAEIAGRGVL